jgi:hypothetical protein
MKKILLSLAIVLGVLFGTTASAQSVFATKIVAKQSVQLRMVGDSMLNNESWGLPRVFAQMVATKYTDATVIFKSRNYPGTGDGTTTDNTIQTGTGGYTVTIIRDSIPGTTSYRADNPNLIFGPGDKSVFIWLGVNDAVNFGLSSSYTPVILAANLRYMGLWAQETYGSEVMLGEPAWSEYEPRVEIAGAAWVVRRTAKLNSFLVAPFRTTLENHFTGTGQAGQGNWFPNQMDNTHCGGDCHVALANTLFAAYGL